MTELWGLTGGMACGKSTVSRMLAARGAVVVDADLLAREVVGPGSAGLAEVVAAFGPQVLAVDGTLDRKQVGALVFAQPAARARLNAITHPRIAALAAQKTLQAQQRGAAVVVYDAALLVENRLHQGMQEVLVVTASPATQLQRIMSRDGLSEAEARARVAAQLPEAEKLKAATLVLHNDGTQEQLEAQLELFWQRVRPRLQANSA